MNDQIKPIDINTKAILDAVITKLVSKGDITKLQIVDVGCGEGRLLDLLIAHGVKKISGVGWDARMPDGIKPFNNVDLSSPNWSDRLGGLKFDWVISTEVIEHLVNPYQFLLELRCLVADNGRLLLTFPNVHNLRSILGYALKGRFSGFFGPNFNDGHPLYDQHIFIPNLHLIQYFLRLTGFEIETIAWVNGKSRLTSQTTLIIAHPTK